MDRLSEIRARCEELEQSGEGFTVVRPVYIQGALLDDGYSEKWSALAAHAREDIPFLLAEIKQSRAERDHIKLSNDGLCVSHDNLYARLREATARAEKAEAERDKAAEFIRWVDDNFSHYMPQEYTDRLMTLERNHFKSPQEGE